MHNVASALAFICGLIVGMVFGAMAILSDDAEDEDASDDDES